MKVLHSDGISPMVTSLNYHNLHNNYFPLGGEGPISKWSMNIGETSESHKTS